MNVLHFRYGTHHLYLQQVFVCCTFLLHNILKLIFFILQQYFRNIYFDILSIPIWYKKNFFLYIFDWAKSHPHIPLKSSGTFGCLYAISFSLRKQTVRQVKYFWVKVCLISMRSKKWEITHMTWIQNIK